MANRYHDKLGFFVIVFYEENPDDFHFLINYKNKLDIADANIMVLRNMNKMFSALAMGRRMNPLNSPFDGNDIPFSPCMTPTACGSRGLSMSYILRFFHYLNATYLHIVVLVSSYIT